jgi:hypothetical protein
MRRIAFLLLTLAQPAYAQDADGNNTPGDWRVTQTAHFGLWDSVCDERGPADALQRRCYIRYVDVFSARPNFAAHFVFVTPAPDGVAIEYGSEAGTRFIRGGLRIENDGDITWSTDRAACLTGDDCTFEGAEATELAAALRKGGEWRFDFADRHGKLQSLAWDLSQVDAAFRDFETESALRGL